MRARRQLFLAVAIQLRPHQITHAQKLASILAQRATAHDGSDCGTGKTYVAAALAGWLNRPPLVICPLSVVPAWRGLLGVDGVVINWESCWRRMGEKIKWGKGSFFKFSGQWPLFIFDECHRAQSKTSMQGKLLIAAKRQILESGGKILTLSATAADSPLKMGPLGFCHDLHDLTHFFDWLDRHGCPEVTLGPEEDPARQWKERIFLKSRQEEVMRQLGRELYETRGARMRIAEIPGFPTTQLIVRLLDGADREVQRLSAELEAHYRERTARAEEAESKFARITFARQAMETLKIPSIMDLTADALETSRVAIFTNYTATLDALAEACVKRKWRFALVRGGQSPLERQAAIAAFQADRLDVVLCNLQAGGVGVSLHGPTERTAIICPTYNSVDLRQCFGRVHRDGGRRSRQFLLYFAQTIEQDVAANVERKLDRLDLLNDGDIDPLAARQAEIFTP